MVEASPLRLDFGPVVSTGSSLEVVGVGQGVPDLFQLVSGHLLGVVTAFDYLSSCLVCHVALFSACPQPATVLVGFSELTGAFDAPSFHVGSGVLPHRVEPRSVRIAGPFGHVFILPELSSLDEPRSLWFLRLLEKTLWSFVSFTTGNLPRR